jgi:hypothetical protein
MSAPAAPPRRPYQAALITGASAGIGAEFARQLADQAEVLVLCARRLDRLEAMAAKLRQRQPGLTVHVRAVDLGDPAALTGLLDWLAAQTFAVDLLINNAGFGAYGPLAKASPERMQAMIDLNISALVRLTLALCPAMVARGRGAILNVGSVAGMVPVPGMATYAATKAFVNSFTESLHAELRGTGVHVSLLCPGPVPTEFSQVASATGQRGPMPGFVAVPAEAAVRAALGALSRNAPRRIPGVLMRTGMTLAEMLPRPLLRLGLRRYARR